MDTTDNLNKVKKQRAFSTKEFIFFLSILVFLVPLAIYFSAPDNYFNKKSDNTAKMQLHEASNDNSAQAIQSGSQLNTNSNKAPEKTNRPGLLASLFNSEKQTPETKNKPGSIVIPMTAEHEKYLSDTYNELYTSAYSNGNNRHLPSISGRVLDTQGSAIRGITIQAIKRNYHKRSSQSTDRNSPQQANVITKTNAEGFYAFTGLSDGIYLLAVENNKRYMPQKIEIRSGVKNADIILTDAESIMLKGVVLDANSKQPLSGVHIVPVIPGRPDTGRSDSEGVFKMEMPIGELSKIPLRLSKKGYRTESASVDAMDYSGQQQMLVEMRLSEDFGSLSGMVLGELGDDMSSETVRLYSPSLKINYKTKVSGGGQYQFKDIEASDDYQLWMRPSSSYKDFNLTGLQVKNDHKQHDIELETIESGYRLSGQVLDLNNRPVSNITLYIRNANARNQLIPLTTDAQGAYSVENVSSGELIIESNSSPFFTVSGIHLSDSNNKTSHQNFIVDQGEGKLLGEVVNQYGDPVAAPKIYITSNQVVNGMRSQSSRNTTANNEGKFVFTDLGAKHYLISVNAPGYKGARVRHVVGRPLLVKLEEES